MFHRRLALIAVAALAAAAACAPMTPAALDKLTSDADCETAIAPLARDDPRSPATLNARLAYADFLSGEDGAGCEQRLTLAQSQLDLVAARPGIDLVLPLAPARIAEDEYKIHLARAACGSQTPLASELQLALAKAKEATERDREALDYQSAAVMQFNVAALYQQLNDADDALAALEAAIAMDRDYGFRQDAQDNTRLLLQWKGEKASDDDVAAVMKDFPARTAAFTFNWPATDADISIQVDETSIIHGKTIESRGATTLTRQIRKSADGWALSSDRAAASYDRGTWPSDAKVSEWSMLYFLASALLETPNIDIGKDGDFQSVPASQDFAIGLASKVFTQISDVVSKDAVEGGSVSGNAITLNLSPAFAPEGEAIVRTLTPVFSPEFVQAKAEEDYGLQTGTWIGAKLEQGVWYQMSTPLFLPGLGLGLYTARHQVSFAFTRDVPCLAGSDHMCAEIVIHASPDAEDLENAFQEADAELELKDGQSLHYWPMTEMRLVIDPTTLLPYLFDKRQSWYDGVEKRDPIIERIRTVTTFAYH